MAKLDRLSTGAPMPAPVWQMVCEFANGSCLCAARGKRPCAAVEAVAIRVADRAFHDLNRNYHLRRRSSAERGTDAL